MAALVVTLVASALIAYVLYRRTSPTLPLGMRLMLGVLRWLAALIILAIVVSPSLRLVRTSSSTPAVAVLVDDSKSMAYPASAGKVDLVKTALSETFASALERQADVRFFAFSDTARQISRAGLAGLSAAGPRTDLVGGLASMLRAFEGRPSAIVLVSDGGANFGEDALHFCSTMKIPVYAVSVGARAPTPDLSVDRVETGKTAYAGSKVPVAVYLSGRSSGAATTLAIRDSTGEVFREQVVVPASGARARIVAEIDAGAVGTHSFTASLGAFDGEQVTANNSMDFSIRVIKGKIKVVLVGSGPSWDFAFARRNLESDPNVELAVALGGAGAVAVKPDGVTDDLGRAIAASDVAVILKGAVLGAARKDLDEFVWKGGRVVLVSPDESADVAEAMNPLVVSVSSSALATGSPTGGTGSAGGSGSTGAGGSPAARSGSRSAPDTRPALYTAVLGEGGVNHEIMDFEAARGGRLWPSLPPIPVDRSISGAKQAATVLLEGVGARSLGGDERTGQPAATALPLVAVMRYGMGHVVALAGHDLWRWDLVSKGFGVEVSAFREILASSIRWLIENEEMKRLALSTSKNDYLWGEPVAVLARVVDANLKPLRGATVAAEVRDRGSHEPLRTSVMDQRSPGNHSLVIDMLRPERYTVRATASIDGKTYAEDAISLSVNRRGIEDADFDGDEALLRDIAGATGGRFYAVEEAGRLPEELNPGRVITKTYKDLRPRLNLITFLILAGLLAAEWLIRRRKMLA